MKNQLLNLKMIALMCLMMVLGGANVWAEQYKIVFAKGSSDNNTAMDNKTSKSDVISSGVEYVASFNTCINVFNKSKNGLKIGKSAKKNDNGSGTIEFSIADGYQKNIKKITIKSAKWVNLNGKSDTGTLSLYNGTTSLKSGITPGSDYTHTFDAPTTVSSIKLSTSAKRAYISEIILETEEANNPTLVASETALDFGSVENNTSKDLTFKLSGSKLTADATLSVDGEYFTVTPTSVAQTDGTITETEVTVSYTPTVLGKHSATITISSTGATDKTISLSGTAIAPLAHYNVSWSVNGQTYTAGAPTVDVVEGKKVSTLPTAPAEIDGKAFVGWTETEISGESTSKPTDLFATVENAPVVSANTTYYAVFANKVGTEYWKKVTAAKVNSEGEGEYALLTPDGHAFNGEINTNGHGLSTADAFTFVDNKAETVPEGTCVLTLTKAGTNGYKMNNAEFGYLSATLDGKQKKLVWHTSENSYWSYSSSNWVYNAMDYYLRTYNKTFRVYAQTFYDHFLFAKKVSDIAYSGYCTTFEAAAEPTYTAQTLTLKAKDATGYYYATFSNEKVVFMPATVIPMAVVVDATGKICEKDIFTQTKATIGAESVDGYYIPAKTGVLLWTDKTSVEYYTVDNYAVDALAADANMLKPSVTAGAFVPENDYLYYKLAYGDWTSKTGLGFYWGADNGGAFYVKAGTAYLAVPEANATGAKGFTLSGEATGIEGVNANVENAKAIYNLNGQRVASMAKPGLYIVNGKKMVVRK